MEILKKSYTPKTYLKHTNKYIKIKVQVELLGLTVDELGYYMYDRKEDIKEQIRNRKYNLNQVSRVHISKDNGDKKDTFNNKKRNDNYYFHYDLVCLSVGSAKVENMMNYSYKRIISSYFSKHKLVILTSNDYENIKKIIEKYYLFK